MTAPLKSQAPHGFKPINVRLQQHGSEVGICNTYSIDKDSLSDFIITSFGLILAKQLAQQWSFAIARTLLPMWKNDFFAYAARVKKAVKVETFEKNLFSFGAKQEKIIPIDFIAMAHQDTRAEISFYGWSLHAVTRITQQSPKESIESIDSEMYAILRCSVHLQMSWLVDLYD
jgi:hypothetical protein